jgi:hypothetical protein
VLYLAVEVVVGLEPAPDVDVRMRVYPEERMEGRTGKE